MSIPKQVVKANGQEVDCYGTWEEDSNCECIFDDEALDGVWCDGAKTWTEVVEILTEYAQRNGTTVVELKAC